MNSYNTRAAFGLLLAISAAFNATAAQEGVKGRKARDGVVEYLNDPSPSWIWPLGEEPSHITTVLTQEKDPFWDKPPCDVFEVKAAVQSADPELDVGMEYRIWTIRFDEPSRAFFFSTPRGREARINCAIDALMRSEQFCGTGGWT
jgi:hypothetical protein